MKGKITIEIEIEDSDFGKTLASIWNGFNNNQLNRSFSSIRYDKLSELKEQYPEQAKAIESIYKLEITE